MLTMDSMVWGVVMSSVVPMVTAHPRSQEDDLE